VRIWLGERPNEGSLGASALAWRSHGAVAI